MNIGLVILAVYIAVLLGIALYASKKDKKNIKDFATGGGLGIFILTLTFSATYHSAYAFMGAGGFAYKNGIGWWCNRHCCKVSDEAAFCLIQRPYISKTLLTRRISPRGSP